MRQVAIIDMGTNTFHLLIAEVSDRGFSILERHRQAVKVGAGGINRGLITPEAEARAFDTLRAFQRILHDYPAVSVQAIATSAFRNASNGADIARKIERELHIPVSIISGEQEATYIFQGIASGLKIGKQPALGVDIGGGSVEFIIGTEEGILWKQSFEVGGQRLLEAFQQHDPMTGEEAARLRSYLDDTLQPLLAALREWRPLTLIGSSGSFDTLSEMYCARHQKKYEADAPETPLTFDGFYELFDEIIHRDRASRLQMPGMIELRVDLIVVACYLIDWLLEGPVDFQHLRVSTYAMKEGVLSTLVTK